MGAAKRLSRRGQEIAELVALGLTNRAMAERLHLSERTVEWHVEQILNKLGFSTRSQIAAWVGRSQALSAVPAPRTIGNLPKQYTSFVGRDLELRSLFNLVSSYRLVTVTGPGGSGKTRLAVRLGEELVAEFQDGVWLCDLAAIADPALVADAIAKALDIKRPGRDRLEASRAYLKDRSAMLILDNCEHVVTAVAQVAIGLLGAGSGIRILATSRRPLGVIGEAICRLDPLSDADALELFRHRLRTALPEFRFGDDNAETIASICRRLDGLPLAIELIVPRLRVQTADELAAAIFDPAWNWATPEDRHGSLRAVAEWSYALMATSEQSLFRSLGVFATWFELQDASAVFSSSAAPVAVLLGALSEQSMVAQEMAPTMHYRLLDTLRVFALQKLAEAGEVERVRLRCTDHVIALIRRMANADESPEAQRKLTAMVDDVRATFGTLLASRPAVALDLSADLMPVWRYDCRYEEGLIWNERALAANPAPTAQRCRSLFQQAFTLIELGRFEEAQVWLREAEMIADESENTELRHGTLIVRANCHALRGDFASGLRLGEEAIELFAAEGNPDALGRALNHSALCLLALGGLREGKAYAERARDLQQRPTPSRMATLDTLAQAHALLGELQPARDRWREALEHGAEVGWKNGIPFCCFGLAYVAGLEGDRDAAIRLHLLAERLNSELNLNYYDPIAQPEADLIARLIAEAGPEEVERLQAESKQLEVTVFGEWIAAVP
jgi:predicted ATPase/DNA-binding CsgD family transcriptional regulator